MPDSGATTSTMSMAYLMIWRGGGIAPEYVRHGWDGKPLPFLFCLFVHRSRIEGYPGVGEPRAAMPRKPSSGEIADQSSPQAPERWKPAYRRRRVAFFFHSSSPG